MSSSKKHKSYTDSYDLTVRFVLFVTCFQLNFHSYSFCYLFHFPWRISNKSFRSLHFSSSLFQILLFLSAIYAQEIFSDFSSYCCFIIALLLDWSLPRGLMQMSGPNGRKNCGRSYLSMLSISTLYRSVLFFSFWSTSNMFSSVWFQWWFFYCKLNKFLKESSLQSQWHRFHLSLLSSKYWNN